MCFVLRTYESLNTWPLLLSPNCMAVILPVSSTQCILIYLYRSLPSAQWPPIHEQSFLSYSQSVHWSFVRRCLNSLPLSFPLLLWIFSYSSSDMKRFTPLQPNWFSSISQIIHMCILIYLCCSFYFVYF